ncbi:threonylcarbamoyl-AMP synthase [Bombiscardovia apis]|uniref:L-threonylcarbamoyladenylate synthase n=1 Tax=Bombiscardovia apis TaxID=2932182 RepID=A0ABN6SG62_9BIFI|nr:L-threonylcarbamoyladenylate synthase [Bombiscardovia apis]BDR55005.1 threonylcarbamoyl-AMP synthase [Bombiscardovia apis]
MTGRMLAIDQDSLAQLKQVISAGGLVVIPTDTVYGIVCDPFNNAAIEALFAAKQRPRSKSLQVLLPSVSAVEQVGLSLPEPLGRLAEAFLPGAFSPICQALDSCQLQTLRQEENGATQAVRVPDCAACLQILSAVGPLAASSANRSGQPSVQSAQEAYEQLGESVDLYLDAGPTAGPIPSTVVAAAAGQSEGIAVLREGAISSERIRAALTGQREQGARQ